MWSDEYSIGNDVTDYYTFTIPCAGQVDVKLMSYGIYGYVTVYDSRYTSMGEFYYSHGSTGAPRTASGEFILSQGTYYVTVDPSSTRYGRNYRLYAAFTSYGINAEEGDSFDSPQTLNLGTKVTGVLTGMNKSDWYKVTVPAAGTYQYNFSSDGYFKYYIYDEHLNSIADESGKLDTGKVKLSAGVYYINIKAHIGDLGKYTYQLNSLESVITEIHQVGLTRVTATYTGHPIQPAVTAYDDAGNVVSPKNYNVTYTNNKNVGQATVTVTFKGSYKGKVSRTFTIYPKGTSLSKVIGKKRAFGVKWKKQSTQTSGYQIQYASNRNFAGAQTLTVKKNKTVSTTVKRLSAKRKYYVRIRTYKNVKINRKSVKLYSNWSKAKTVRTKR